MERDLSQWKELEKLYNEQQKLGVGRSLRNTCPSCGYCEHCGRGGDYGLRPYFERNLPGRYEWRPNKVYC